MVATQVSKLIIISQVIVSLPSLYFSITLIELGVGSDGVSQKIASNAAILASLG